MYTSMRFLKRLPLYVEEKPYRLFTNLPPESTDQRHTNLDFEEKKVQVHDIRDKISPPTLDANGFEVRRIPTCLDLGTMWDREMIEKVYLPEVDALLREDSSIHEVFLFDWRIRHSNGPGENSIDINDLTTQLSPAAEAHVDQSPGGVLHRVQLQLPDKAERLLQGRIRVINLWRPLVHVVEKDPLAVCDSSTVLESELVPCDYVRRSFVGETMFVHYSPAQKWYYLSAQSPEEVLMLKIFDSSDIVPAKNCPHVSFKIPDQSGDARPRQSIEVRALMFGG